MQITFDTNNLTSRDLEILDALATHLATTSVPTPAPEAETAPAAAPAVDEPKKRGRKKAETVAQPEPAPEPAPEPQADASDEAGEELELPVDEPQPAKTLTIDDVRGALQQFTAAKGVPEGIKLLKEFSAGRISELKAEDYADFVARCAA